MSDALLQQAVKVIDTARNWPAADATKAILASYQSASPDFRDAIVLALIGEVVVSSARRRCADDAARGNS